MLDSLTDIFKKRYHYLNWIEINQATLVQNYNYLTNLSSSLKIAPVLKSNAYGHGLIEVARILDPVAPPFLCVDSLHEAYILEKAKIKSPILIMGYTNPENFKVKKLPFTFAVFDINTAKILNEYQPGASVHLKIDTGMHRLGILSQNLPQFLKQFKKLKNLQLDGVMSHFAKADSVNDLFTKQIENFQIAKRTIVEEGFAPSWYHISASVPLLHQETSMIISNLSNMARVGRALYGACLENERKLSPVLKLSATLVQIKKIKKGEMIGYDGTYKAKKNMLAGTLSAGYYDGIDRRLSDKGLVFIDGKPCPIIGRVSMNMTSVDLSKLKMPKVGDQAIIIADQKDKPNSVIKMAKICGTVGHDILAGLNCTTKRIIIEQ